MAERSESLPSTPIAENRSMSEIVQDILRDIQNVLRAEVRLARTEIGEQVQKAGKAAGFLGAAALFGFLAAACVLTACIAALALIVPLWLAALLIGIILGGIACGSFIIGRTRLQDVDTVPHRTLETLKEDIEWAKHRTS